MVCVWKKWPTGRGGGTILLFLYVCGQPRIAELKLEWMETATSKLETTKLRNYFFELEREKIPRSFSKAKNSPIA